MKSTEQLIQQMGALASLESEEGHAREILEQAMQRLVDLEVEQERLRNLLWQHVLKEPAPTAANPLTPPCACPNCGNGVLDFDRTKRLGESEIRCVDCDYFLAGAMSQQELVALWNNAGQKQDELTQLMEKHLVEVGPSAAGHWVARTHCNKGLQRLRACGGATPLIAARRAVAFVLESDAEELREESA